MVITFLGNFNVDFSSETHHKKSLESLGHTVISLQEGVDSAETVLRVASQSDMFVWVHTHGWHTPGMSMIEVLKRLKQLAIPTVTYHLDLWFGLQRQDDLQNDPFYNHIGHFFTVDKLMADWFNKNTDVKGHYLPAGVLQEECYISDEKLSKDTAASRDVIFVGSKGYHTEWPYRPQLIKWLKDTYGDRFTHIGGDGEIGTTRGAALNSLYASSKIVVGDTLCIGFDYPYYWSDRVFETMGRGGFIIHPYIKGMEEYFTDRKHLAFYNYGDMEQLKATIDYYLDHEDERESIRIAGQEHVKENHTYKHRWQHIISQVSNA